MFVVEYKILIKFFNQECVRCLESPSVYEFRQRGRQCVCKKKS